MTKKMVVIVITMLIIILLSGCDTEEHITPVPRYTGNVSVQESGAPSALPVQTRPISTPPAVSSRSFSGSRDEYHASEYANADDFYDDYYYDFDNYDDAEQ